jgi:hypothetical protein
VDYLRDAAVVADALRAQLGDKTPSDFRKDAPRDKVSRMVEVFEHVRLHADLTGDPARLEVLRKATTALANAVADADLGLKLRAEAVQALAAAEVEFDAAWGLFVAAALRHERTGLAPKIPTFHRSRSGPAAADPEVPADVVAAAPAETDTVEGDVGA